MSRKNNKSSPQPKMEPAVAEEAVSEEVVEDAATEQVSEDVTEASVEEVETSSEEVAPSPDDVLIVSVPRTFKLRIDNHKIAVVHAGVQKMKRSEAEHWYSKVNGVEVFKG